MQEQIRRLSIFILFFMVFLGHAFAADTASATKKQGTLFAYKPPLRGAPAMRIGGGSRGVSDQEASLSVLAPEHTGLTALASPALYWYISKEVSTPVEITLIADDIDEPLFEKVLPSVKEGVHKFDLAEYGIKLQEGVEYSWYVAVILDSAQRSNDIITGATILYSRPLTEITEQLAKANKTLHSGILAEGGIWYDSIAALSEQIESNPKNLAPHNERAALLEQVGLRDAAAADRQQGENAGIN